jgi:hypothetical protein
MHRWFIEYNPLYLISAAMVLAGATVVSHEVTRFGLGWGGAIVGAVAEVYALLLIGGAALLVRVGLRRPATMLALLAVLFQVDLTMQVETLSYHGIPGGLGVALWAALCLGKARWLELAMRVQLSRGAWTLLAVGVTALAVTPMLLRAVSPDERGVVLSVALGVVGVVVGWVPRTVRALDTIDLRGRRAIHAAWCLLGTLAFAHVLWWFHEYRIALVGPVLWIAPLVATRWMRSELSVWCAVAAVLVGSAMVTPGEMWLTASMVAAVLLVRVWWTPVRVRDDVPTRSGRSHEPYRAAMPPTGRPVAGMPPTPMPTERWVLVAAPASARLRLITGIVTSLYLAVWTGGWQPADMLLHVGWLDALFVVVALSFGWHRRSLVPVVPVAASSGHLLVQLGWVDGPSSTLGWGIAILAGGFVVLLGALGYTWYTRREENDAPLRGAVRPLSGVAEAEP